MANYKRGTNRIFYQPPDFAAAVVTAYFYTPKLVQTNVYTFTQLEPGLYYLDFKFEDIGDYIGVFYENGIKKHTRVFKVETGYSLYWNGEPLL